MKRLLRSPAFQAVASAVLAVGLFVFFLSRVPLAQIGARIASASPAWLAASVVVSLSTFAFRALRWTWILRPVGRVPWFPAFRATAIGFAANTVLPARAGEVIRPAMLARDRGLPFPALLASIVFERILDALSQLCFLGLALALGPSGAAALSTNRVRLAVAAVAAVAVGVAVFAVFWRPTTERLFDRVFSVLPPRLRGPANRAAATFLDGFASLRTPGLAALVAGGSLAMWFVINIQIYCVMRAFDVRLPVSAAWVVTSAAVLGLAVPTPGGVGGYHAAVQFALTDFFGVPLATATGVALLAHAVSFGPISLIGFALFAASPLRRRGLQELAARDGGTPPEVG
ncbi:MAG: lysylphosphatidylglycerol synthase transmembrane domain-containing protein [Syntrophomonadaceae bacterium]